MAWLDYLLGRPLTLEEEEEEKIGVLAGVPLLGLDGLSSAAYGPEAALAVLLPLGLLGIDYIVPITGIILAILGILYFSYRQTIAAYPGGGGSYTVAKQNLGKRYGLLAASALIVDYILNVAVGIAAGVGALVSAFPVLHSHTLALCLGILLLITIINLRGTKESGITFALPTYLFVATLAAILLLGLWKVISSSGLPQPMIPPQALPAGAGAASVWILMRSFASGCTAMTGVEAVSNGVGAFAKPAVSNAQKTLTVIVAILAILLLGIAFLARMYGIGAMDQNQPGYQSILSQLAAAIVGRGAFYYVTIGSVLLVLSLSANTSFAGFPRLCRLLAEDGFLPHSFAIRGRRLVYSVGILFLAGLSAGILVMFGGITDRLIPLFAVGAFGAFTLSQAGMVVHWLKKGGHGSRVALTINMVGAVGTFVALIVILMAKFVEGAWITVLIVPLLFVLFIRVKAHYTNLSREIHCAHGLKIQPSDQPVVVVPYGSWDLRSERALRFATMLSKEVTAVHVETGEENIEEIRRIWKHNVTDAFRLARQKNRRPGHIPQLVILSSPYRRLISPFLSFIDELKQKYPDRMIAVVIPDLVEAKWYQFLLHNQRAAWLRTQLLLRGDHQVVVINIPWYLGDHRAPGVASRHSS